tara:strand:+ start:810 stop:1211 length:402 start_codon:yes stop_codon:yes gene_type:complete
MNGYFAVQLDKQSCNVVKKLATKDILVSDHVTLAYKPIKKVYDKYSKLVGKKVGVFIKGYRANNHIDALWVDNMFDKDGNKIKRHDKGAAHITLSHKVGYKSGDANTMFTNPKVKNNKYGYVEGKVKYISYVY